MNVRRLLQVPLTSVLYRQHPLAFPLFGNVHSRTYIKKYTLRGSGVNCNTKSKTSVTDHTIISDVPVLSGGCNEGPQPVELLLHALIGCETATAAFLARKLWHPKDIHLSRIDYDIWAERDEQGSISAPYDSPPKISSRILRIGGTASLTTSATNNDIQVLKHMVHLRCPVASTLLASGCLIEIEWVHIPSQKINMA